MACFVTAEDLKALKNDNTLFNP